MHLEYLVMPENTEVQKGEESGRQKDKGANLKEIQMAKGETM